MEFLSIDSIEEDYAICEDDSGSKYIIDFYDLPPGAQEGMILKLSSDEKWIIDKNLTKKRKEEILKLRKEVYRKN